VAAGGITLVGAGVLAGTTDRLVSAPGVGAGIAVVGDAMLAGVGDTLR
jgi:hypothetical protein